MKTGSAQVERDIRLRFEDARFDTALGAEKRRQKSRRAAAGDDHVAIKRFRGHANFFIIALDCEQRG